MPAQYVKPYVKTNKSDYIDAEAIAEVDLCGLLGEEIFEEWDPDGVCGIHNYQREAA
jgi:hypothetical protein